MDEFSQRLDTFLVHVFNGILKYEEEMIQQNNDIDISINELHLIDAVGRCEQGSNTVSDLAVMLDITNSSVTIAVNKLVLKGYLSKSKGSKDGRTVYVHLTERGTHVYRYHQEFHHRMVAAISRNLEEEEKQILVTAIEKLSLYFQDKRKREKSQKTREIPQRETPETN